MSRRRRIRRQNRLYAIESPATRDTRLSLAPSLERRLQSPFQRSLDRVRDIIRPQDSEIKQPADRQRRRIMLDARRATAIRRANRLVAGKNPGLISVGQFGKIQVDLPPDHPICRKRRERRELIFAKRKAGKGGQKSPRMPELIVRCK